MSNSSNKYMNPYIAGVLLGLVLLASFYLTGRGLGASGALRSVVVEGVGTVSPEYAAHSGYFSKYFGEGKHPMKSWLVLEVFGVLVGVAQRQHKDQFDFPSCFNYINDNDILGNHYAGIHLAHGTSGNILKNNKIAGPMYHTVENHSLKDNSILYL